MNCKTVARSTKMTMLGAGVVTRNQKQIQDQEVIWKRMLSRMEKPDRLRNPPEEKHTELMGYLDLSWVW
jgi:hypothetical protein